MITFISFINTDSGYWSWAVFHNSCSLCCDRFHNILPWRTDRYFNSGAHRDTQILCLRQTFPNEGVDVSFDSDLPASVGYLDLLTVSSKGSNEWKKSQNFLEVVLSLSFQDSTGTVYDYIIIWQDAKKN